MKIASLFSAYNQQLSAVPDSTAIFANAGMTTDSAKLEFGFFPLGSGILTDQSSIAEAEILEGGTMVLGHDFGTVSYVRDRCKNKRENNSRTIKNLQGIGLQPEHTFFTNFYLGLRDDTLHPKMEMTTLVVKRTEAYTNFCFDFFKTQLEMINPKLVVCIGKEVGLVLPGLFAGLTKSGSLLSLFANDSKAEYLVTTNDAVYGNRKYLLIPHPSYAHINWANGIKEKIKAAITEE